MCVGCVVGSLLAKGVFLRVLHFLPSTKTSLNSSLTRIDPHENQLELIFNKTGLNMFDILAFSWRSLNSVRFAYSADFNLLSTIFTPSVQRRVFLLKAEHLHNDKF